MTIEEKYQGLLDDLRAAGSLAVAFSGGVDSCFLLRAAQEALGERVLAVTAVSDFVPPREAEEALSFCQALGIRHELLHAQVLDIPGVRENPPDRCYLCKRSLFEQMLSLAREKGMELLAEGSNLDDEGDYRPGLRAIRELGVLSPLRKAGLRKSEIRELSRRLGLPSWDKPSFACLASRFVYGEALDSERLRRVDRAEELLRSRGFRQYRVRVHGELARIEVPAIEIEKILAIRELILQELKNLGFRYVTLDLEGYRTGSMNETLSV